jgi:hypothetical protein
MAKQIPSIALAACIVTLSSIGMPTAQAKQQCSAAMPSNPHGRWWSYRFIDGRKCWYEGKPMLSKSLLEWPKQASAQPNSDGELAKVLTDKPSSPLDSQATAATPVPAPEQKANNTDRSGHAETVLRGDAEKTAAASPNEPPTGSAQNQPVDTAWVVSETTSPVDYSPLITAVIRSTSSVKDAPSTLAVRCRGLRTELLLRTEGAWRAARGSEIQVDYQINDQPFVRLPWAVSADGKTASYKDDAVGLLQSLPEGARLKISVFDRQGLGQEATFQLTGLDSVRKKIGLACKWPSTADKMSSGKR